MKKEILLFLVGLTVSSQAYSISVCNLKSISIPQSNGYSDQQINTYSEKLNFECELSKKYEALKLKASKLGIQLENINEYQAMRYFRRADYLTRGIQPNITLDILYQKKKVHYNLDSSQKSNEIWMNWLAGIEQLPEEVEKLNNDITFDLNSLKSAHKKFYSYSQEDGDFSHVPNPGDLKPKQDNDGIWWKLNPNKITSTQAEVDELNRNYEKLGLLGKMDDTNDPLLNKVIRLKPVDDTMGVMGGDSKVNQEHVETILKFMNEMLRKNASLGVMEKNGVLFTPAELAYLVQQFYVQVHPFYEGNGRTSRFLQELILQKYNLPHGSSGDLMDIDVLTNHSEYYSVAMNKTKELLDRVEVCLDKQKQNLIFSYTKKVSESDQSNINYECRYLELDRTKMKLKTVN
jgi:hypothetical protein